MSDENVIIREDSITQQGIEVHTEGVEKDLGGVKGVSLTKEQ